MRKALYILGQLNDSDVLWLARHGTVRRLADGEVIVHEGRAINAIFITLGGQFRVVLDDGQEVSRMSAGEVVGEIAFVDASPPTATVAAVGEATVPTRYLSARYGRSGGPAVHASGASPSRAVIEDTATARAMLIRASRDEAASSGRR